MGKSTPQARVVLQPSPGCEPGVWHAYQRYYTMGLRKLDNVQFSHASFIDGTFASARERGFPGAYTGWEYAARNADLRSDRATHVGRYTVQFPDSTSPLRVAIDAHDGRDIRDPDALEWSQVYFKASYWPNLRYGPKVRPLVCGNGALDEKRIARLRGLRGQSRRDLDLVFIAKLWPSNPAASTYWNPVEHLVRVFETLAKLNIRSYLRAVLVPLAGRQPFPQHYLDRLSTAGVPIIATDVTVDDLWSATSTSQLAFLRPGKHLCVSWRMIDHLAMGAATVCDHAAYPQWPVPLQAGREFMDAGCGIAEDESLPDLADYARISDTVMDLLAEPDRLEESRHATASYFDRHVAPERIARYLIDAAASVANEVKGKNIATIAAKPPAASEPDVPLAATVKVDDAGVHPSQTSLLEFTNDAVIIWEMNGRGILYWNRAAEKLYGFNREESHGRTTHALLATQLVGGINTLEMDLAKFGVWVGELQHTDKSGKQVYVEARLAMLSQSSGRWLVLEVNRDVSDQKRAAEQSDAMRQQLGRVRELQVSQLRSRQLGPVRGREACQLQSGQ